ncbi:Hypothetical protein BN69_0766 [Methylocystis sp. SC2]|nr:Hypothetical protein BN69_0766 [Methylocystis sp. SC2]
MASPHRWLIAALSAAIFLGSATAEAQRRTPSDAAVSPTEHFGEKAPLKEEPAPQRKKPVSGEEDARPGVGEVSKEPQVPTKARSIRLDPAAQPTPKP